MQMQIRTESILKEPINISKIQLNIDGRIVWQLRSKVKATKPTNYKVNVWVCIKFDVNTTFICFSWYEGKCLNVDRQKDKGNKDGQNMIKTFHRVRHSKSS